MVNHLDKLKDMTGKNSSQAIIRTSIGSEAITPQSQHVGDFTSALKSMCKNINIVKLKNTKDILKEYKLALGRKDNVSTILIEYGTFIMKNK